MLCAESPKLTATDYSVVDSLSDSRYKFHTHDANDFRIVQHKHAEQIK